MELCDNPFFNLVLAKFPKTANVSFCRDATAQRAPTP